MISSYVWQIMDFILNRLDVDRGMGMMLGELGGALAARGQAK